MTERFKNGAKNHEVKRRKQALYKKKLERMEKNLRWYLSPVWIKDKGKPTERLVRSYFNSARLRRSHNKLVRSRLKNKYADVSYKGRFFRKISDYKWDLW